MVCTVIFAWESVSPYMRTSLRVNMSPEASMKKTRKITETLCGAATTTALLPPSHTSPQNETVEGAAAGAGGVLGLPVCAIDSISAAAFFTSATGLDDFCVERLTDAEMVFAASGTRSHSATASSLQ